MPKRNIALYLEDIKTSIRRIEKYAKRLSFSDFEILWETIKKDIPELKKQINKIKA